MLGPLVAGIVFGLAYILLYLVYFYFIHYKKEKCHHNMFAAQSDQNNIYNISGSVQGQNQHAYPDAYLSIDHIAITNELNKPPPKYDDAPPSYEEALKLAMAHSNSLQTYQSEQGHSADLPRTHLPAGSSID
ncbi:uncharacterized protein LOC126742867 isoform X11 [Anthonomus grandis grandis]|uniref:uncharacterized protein LOC126742867 isoform X11 n=1 Tax=Anthonomus grandis grandis TaxID=2921223 RepID=UPI0021662BC2|nr:uncharacterized protein LOC126742867 isoform X11 [Anthonomus grandis grandis]